MWQYAAPFGTIYWFRVTSFTCRKCGVFNRIGTQMSKHINCKHYLIQHCTMNNKLTFDSYVPLTCFDFSKVIIRETYTNAHKYSKLYQICVRVDLKYSMVQMNIYYWLSNLLTNDYSLLIVQYSDKRYFSTDCKYRLEENNTKSTYSTE
jgi:hypothetical protein